jgi:hypothetical protein
MLVDLRAAIDDALGRGTRSMAKAKTGSTAPKNAAVAPPAPSASRTVAAAASAAGSAKFNVTDDATPEFEVSGGANEWNPNGENGN